MNKSVLTAALFAATLLLTACATTKTNQTNSKQESSSTNSYKAVDLGPVELLTDQHSQAIYAILNAIESGDLVKLGMLEEFKKQSQEDSDLPPAYFECIVNQVTDNRVLSFLGPIYKEHISLENALELASFFKTPSGEKFAKIAQRGGGKEVTIPQMTAEDIQLITPMLPKMKALSSPGLLNELSEKAESFGMQLGLSCANALF